METSVSLLERIRSCGDPDDWQQLTELYTPLIRIWIRRYSSSQQEVEDVTQDVLAVVVRRLPDFARSRPGSFRTWLRTITVNCLRDSWKKKRLRPVVAGGSSFQQVLEQLSDPHSELSRLWNDEHDQHVLQSLLTRIRPTIPDQMWQSFFRVAMAGEAVDDVAEDLGVTVNSIYIARSRVMARLRAMGQELID
ncbi:MAG: sigma-70 family RNA polymerase sigma factor [Planctomycetaceae bacterium]|nr:sigma-70 family RNA polymerase sigma factor [Planctomycetaceae bacterium]